MPISSFFIHPSAFQTCLWFLGKNKNADTFRRDLHPDLRADYVLANPPFNDSDWFRKDDDVRFFSLSASNGERAGVRCRNPLTRPKGNANFAWVQHFIHHLAPGGAGRCKVRVQKSELRSFRVFNSTFEIHHSAFVPSSNQSGEGDIRRALIEADLVPRVTATGNSLRRKVRKTCLPFVQEALSELCEK